LYAIAIRQRDLKRFELHCVTPRRREVRKHIKESGAFRQSIVRAATRGATVDA
jgi:hypothetical protein